MKLLDVTFSPNPKGYKTVKAFLCPHGQHASFSLSLLCVGGTVLQGQLHIFTFYFFFFYTRDRLDWTLSRSWLTKCVSWESGIEPGSIAWKATMLTFTPPTRWSWNFLTSLFHRIQRATKRWRLFCVLTGNMLPSLSVYYASEVRYCKDNCTFLHFTSFFFYTRDRLDWILSRSWLTKCVSRESNPDLLLGRQQC